jgi:hypothetical protein
MRLRSTRIGLIAYGLLAQSAGADELIKPTLDVQDLRVLVSYLSTGELIRLQE